MLWQFALFLCCWFCCVLSLFFLQLFYTFYFTANNIYIQLYNTHAIVPTNFIHLKIILFVYLYIYLYIYFLSILTNILTKTLTDIS